MRTLHHLPQIGEITVDHAKSFSFQINSNNFELLFVLQGKLHLRSKHQSLSLYPSYFAELNGCGSFELWANDVVPTRYVRLSLSPSFVAGNSAMAKCVASASYQTSNLSIRKAKLHAINGYLAGYMLRLHNQVLEAGCSDDLLVSSLSGCLAQFGNLLIQQRNELANQLPLVKASTRYDLLQKLALAKDFMVGNHQKPITVEDVASQACLSVNHLLRTFKEVFHLSPHQFLTATRLDAARLLLKTGSFPVNDVVQRVGFECPSSFIRLFKNRYHITPMQYKKQFLS